MRNVTVRLSEEKVESLDVEASDLDLSRADYLRDLISKGRESEELQSECERLRHELEATQQRLSDQKEEHETEVVALQDEIKSLQEERDDLLEAQDHVEDLEREIDRLKNEKQTLISQHEEHGELVEYVEEERSLQEQERERRGAPAWRRAKYWIFGLPDNDE